MLQQMNDARMDACILKAIELEKSSVNVLSRIWSVCCSQPSLELMSTTKKSLESDVPHPIERRRIVGLVRRRFSCA